MPEMPEHHDEGSAIASTGAGGATDLAMSEAETLEKVPGGPDGTGPDKKARSLWSDAWHDLRRNPIFIISGLIILFLVVIAIWPQLIASGNPLDCDLSKAQEGSQPGHPSASTARAATSTPARSTEPGPPSRSASSPPSA